jgi:hypothetical protein
MELVLNVRQRQTANKPKNLKNATLNSELKIVKSMIMLDNVSNATVISDSGGQQLLPEMLKPRRMECGLVLKMNSEPDSAINIMLKKIVWNVNGTKKKKNLKINYLVLQNLNSE